MAIRSTLTHLTAARVTCRRWPRATRTPILAASLFIVGCGGGQPEITPATLDADRLLFARGTLALEDGDWIRAREYFTQIRDNYPQSAFRAEARLRVADTLRPASVSPTRSKERARRRPTSSRSRSMANFSLYIRGTSARTMPSTSSGWSIFSKCDAPSGTSRKRETRSASSGISRSDTPLARYWGKSERGSATRRTASRNQIL
jgi:hypothetical protein